MAHGPKQLWAYLDFGMKRGMKKGQANQIDIHTDKSTYCQVNLHYFSKYVYQLGNRDGSF